MKKSSRSTISLMLLIITTGLIYSGIEMEGDKLDSGAIHFHHITALHHVTALLFIILLFMHLWINKSILISYINPVSKGSKGSKDNADNDIL